MDAGAERLEALLVDVGEQLELGRCRVQEALRELRAGGAQSLHGAAGSPDGGEEPAAAEGEAGRGAGARRHGQRSLTPTGARGSADDAAARSTGLARQPQLAAGEPLARPRRARHAASFRVPSCSSAREAASGAGCDGPIMAALVAERSLEIHHRLRALVAERATEQPPQVVPPQERRPRRPRSVPRSSGSATPDSAATPDSPVESPWRCADHHGGEDQSRSAAEGALPMVAPQRSQRSVQPQRSRRPSVRSIWSTARSVFVSDNVSLAPVASQPGATSAMDMIQHDAVRSYDLRPFWRQTTPRHDIYSGARRSNSMASRMPWSVRKWLSQFDVGPSLTQCRAKRLVTSARYEVCVMLLIVANSVFVGYQVEHEAHTRRQMQSLEVEAFFCVVFILELAVKVYAMSWSFWMGSDASWNLFDMFVVVLMVLDFSLSVSQPTAESMLWSQGQVLRVLRVLRVVRFLRSVRQLRFFMQLRIMIQSIMFSLRPLLWASIVLIGMFYVFGIILTQGVIDNLKEHDSWDDESSSELRFYFGTLECTALSLFQAMSGGINWGELFAALSPLAVHFRLVFLFYVLFAIFGAANVVTGIFVEIANHWARNDKASQEQDATDKRLTSIKRLHELFDELDPDGDGTVTFESMHQALLDVNNCLVSSFHALDLDVTDVRTLFLLLDRDRKGFINVDEFLLGCFRLKGEAKTIDVMKLQYQCEWIMHNMVSMMDTLNHLDALEKTEPSLHPGTDDAGPARSATPVAQLNV